MSLPIYMDVHIPWAITKSLRARGVDVLTAQEDGAATLDDVSLLNRATALGRILFTFDRDFLRIASAIFRQGGFHSGIVIANRSDIELSGCISDLELIAKASNPPDIANRVEYLPY